MMPHQPPAQPVPPHAIESEQSLLGAILINNDALDLARQHDAPCRRRGLPISDPEKVEPWRDVAEHCLQLDWIIPKAHGGKFLTKDERAWLKVLARHYGPVTNATADWLETVLARIEAARQSWRDRGKGGLRPDKSATESDIEKAAQIIAAAKRREASKLDTPEPRPHPQGPAQSFANSFAEFFNRPEYVAERNEREARRRAEAAAIIERYGSEDALFEDRPRSALRSMRRYPWLRRASDI